MNKIRSIPCRDDGSQHDVLEERRRRRLTIPPILSDMFQDFDDNRALEHERVICAFDHLDLALIGTHSVFHPPHRVLRNLLVPVAIPDSDAVGVCGVRESPGLSIMI